MASARHKNLLGAPGTEPSRLVNGQKLAKGLEFVDRSKLIFGSDIRLEILEYLLRRSVSVGNFPVRQSKIVLPLHFDRNIKIKKKTMIKRHYDKKKIKELDVPIGTVL